MIEVAELKMISRMKSVDPSILAVISVGVAFAIMGIEKSLPPYLFQGLISLVIVCFSLCLAMTLLRLGKRVLHTKPSETKISEASLLISDEEWMRRVLDGLKNANGVSAYLRGFDHPEHFKEPHRDTLLGIMREFSRLIWYSSENTRIIAYKTPNAGGDKCPKEWLIDDIMERFGNKENVQRGEVAKKVEKSLTVTDCQIRDNAYTFYLPSGGRNFLYNLHKDGTIKFYSMEFEPSIIPYLIERGLKVTCENRTR
ncbi:hypothetical protein GGQ74_001535 [Desulfobaculum xiamenense]|uniref:Uncharacterized protein n=1 Tax=Desulfobaculum xiamenense TaxID=995050 RepID=A0A846QR80_9BACT|nr:hypothetical protein [Desulfobaculum xiamenense]NJB67895.1 hypothetical protein [Desulfobaculum xiamenense]